MKAYIRQILFHFMPLLGLTESVLLLIMFDVMMMMGEALYIITHKLYSVLNALNRLIYTFI